MTLFNNIFFYIFLLFLISYIILKTWYNIIAIKKEDSLSEFLQKLNTYRITNIYYTLFILLFYFCFTILLFFCFRYAFLGTKYNIYLVNFDETFIKQGICITLCITFYLKLIYLDFYFNILKLHFYLVYYNEYYNNLCLILNGHYSIIENFCRVLHKWCYLLICDTNEIKINYRRIYKLYRKLSQKFKYKRLWRCCMKINVFLSNHNYFKIIFIKLTKTILFIQKNGYRFIYYIPYTTLIVAFLYEINYGYFSIIYYILLFIFINTYIKKIRLFYHIKDPYLDSLIAYYFYKDETIYNHIKNFWLEKKNINLTSLLFMSDDIKDIINHKTDIINYILTDYKVYYAANDNNKMLNRYYYRLHIILILLILNLYFFYFNKIMVIIFLIYKIKLYLVTIPMLFLLYWLNKNILFFDTLQDGWVEKKIYKVIFYIVLFCYTMALLLFYLKNKITIMPSEIILSIESIIIFKECFSLQEKYKYICDYFIYLHKREIYDSEDLFKILANIITNNLISEQMTLSDIRSIIQKFLEEQPVIKPTKEYFYIKIFKWIKSLK